MEEKAMEGKALTDEEKLALALKIAAILKEETDGDGDAMAFAIKTAAGLIWGSDYRSFVNL
jgi:hypothetical protein